MNQRDQKKPQKMSIFDKLNELANASKNAKKTEKDAAEEKVKASMNWIEYQKYVYDKKVQDVLDKGGFI